MDAETNKINNDQLIEVVLNVIVKKIAFNTLVQKYCLFLSNYYFLLTRVMRYMNNSLFKLFNFLGLRKVDEKIFRRAKVLYCCEKQMILLKLIYIPVFVTI